MLRLTNTVKNIFSKVSNVSKIQNFRITTTPINQLKEIRETREDKKIIVEGVKIPSPREPYLIKTIPEVGNDPCPVCRLGLDVKHTDVLILSQFLRVDGCMLPRRITGLCKKQQQRITILVAMAQKAGLMSNIAPENSKKDPKRRSKWKKFNTYYDESTIVLGPPRYFKRKPILAQFSSIR